MSEKLELDGRRALVTGGTKGIGPAEGSGGPRRVPRLAVRCFHHGHGMRH